MATISLTRTVAADPRAAFRAWTDPAELARWWWPQWPDTTYAVDARVGGRYLFHSGRVGMGVQGEYLSIDRPDAFTMTWAWIEDDAEATDTVDTVEVTFRATENGTVVTVTHTTDDAGSENYRQGWNDVLDRLPGLR